MSSTTKRGDEEGEGTRASAFAEHVRGRKLIPSAASASPLPSTITTPLAPDTSRCRHGWLVSHSTRAGHRLALFFLSQPSPTPLGACRLRARAQQRYPSPPASLANHLAPATPAVELRPPTHPTPPRQLALRLLSPPLLPHCRGWHDDRVSVAQRRSARLALRRRCF
ncbi:hypothetical protein K523DRAFT_359162 [Schizophyllum commune Tattone D]|nr:hypothetical protein K523DRAFT_359162 [Schizophyllum commune Tattone D]